MKKIGGLAMLIMCVFLAKKTQADGIEYSCVVLADSKQKMHIASIDIKKMRSISVRKAAGDLCDREELSSLCLRHSPSIAVNAGGFRRGGRFNGCPHGLVIIDSFPYTDPGFIRPIFLLDNENKTIDLQLKKIVWSVKIGDQEVIADRINQPAVNNEVVFFNTFFGSETRTNVEGIELVVERGKLVQIRNFCGSAPLARQGYIVRIGLQHPLAQIDWKKYLGQPCTANIATEMLDLQRDGVFAIQGLTMLVDNGCVVGNWKQQLLEGVLPMRLADEFGIDLRVPQALDDFINKPNAHAALGITADGIVKIVAFDGGSAGSQIGVDIAGIAKIMLDLGCLKAMLLGSGGDVGLWVCDHLVMEPSGNDQMPGRCEERPISTALMFFEEKDA